MDENESVWITGRTAEQLLGVGRGKITRIAAASGIRQQVIPGIWVRYHRDDIEALARQSVRGHAPATST